MGLPPLDTIRVRIVVGALGGIRSRGSVLRLLISRVDGVTGHHPGPLNDQGVFVVSWDVNFRVAN